MRLAVLSPFVDRRHGTERAVAELVERLARDCGCEVHLYAQCVQDLEISTSRTKVADNTGRIIWHRVPRIPGPHLLQFLAWTVLNGFLRRWHAFRTRSPYEIVFSPGINCLHPDVVVVHALFHRLRELAVEGSDDSGSRSSIFRRCHRRLYYGLLTCLERRIYSNPRVALAAVSKRTAGLLKTYFGRDNVAVIPNGVDGSHFSRGARLSRRSAARQRRDIQDEDCVLLLIGNDWRVKGLPVILRAMAALRDLPLRLLVVGTDAAESFRSQAAQLDLQDRCLFESPTSDVLELYAAGDVYVSPSREDSFGLPVAEAMACGLPVITSVSAGIADYIQSGVDGLVLPDPGDSGALAVLLRRLESDEELRRRLGEAAVLAVRQLTWDRQAEVIAPMLKQLQERKKTVRI